MCIYIYILCVYIYHPVSTISQSKYQQRFFDTAQLSINWTSIMSGAQPGVASQSLRHLEECIRM